ncbi:uncharacterized protein MONBRDRAFT_35854 [Monosiga brevicollis MX1]|uniref:MI domain-containing protein n=1 Tax=Monosiga brevicollis TaxID=81824 RepID=A9US75_MONBE|nr:uncharacterized protein MONBRDRAFT_35854 [Monosiga brevicollis MX1]EDQ92053.1 predicted protein [Monosiga brevicollis MX1]|eukprot:XP_001743339.1 hypothetical protein [Monosiga brevicollis MX1]
MAPPESPGVEEPTPSMDTEVEDSKVKGEKLARKSENCIKEFIVNPDKKEIELLLESSSELGVKGGHEAFVSSLATRLAFFKKADQDLVMELFEHLLATDKLESEALEQGLSDVLRNMPDIKLDAPRFPELCARIMATAFQHERLPLSFINGDYQKALAPIDVLRFILTVAQQAKNVSSEKLARDVIATLPKPIKEYLPPRYDESDLKSEMSKRDVLFLLQSAAPEQAPELSADMSYDQVVAHLRKEFPEVTTDPKQARAVSKALALRFSSVDEIDNALTSLTNEQELAEDVDVELIQGVVEGAKAKQFPEGFLHGVLTTYQPTVKALNSWLSRYKSDEGSASSQVEQARDDISQSKA